MLAYEDMVALELCRFKKREQIFESDLEISFGEVVCFVKYFFCFNFF